MENNEDPRESRAKAKDYQARRNRYFIAGLAIHLGGLVLALITGWTHLFKDWAAGVSGHPAAVVALYFLLFSLYFLCLSFPFDIYTGYTVEKRFGLSTQSFGAWLREEAKKQVIGFVLFLPLIEMLYFFLGRFPRTWWLFAWAGWMTVTLLVGKFAHLIILPLFYKCVPLENEEVRQKILHLVARNRFPIRDVYSINLSKTTRKVNAAFTGLGSTRRVLLADTLLEKFTALEIESVVAHELGHARRHHLIKGVIFNSAVSLAVFYLAFLFLGRWAAPLGFEGPSDIAALPLLGLVSFFSGVLLMPVNNAYSRFHEREADDFALRESDRAAFVSALTKLGEINLADFEPSPAVEFFLYSHPALGKRIRRAQTF